MCYQYFIAGVLRILINIVTEQNTEYWVENASLYSLCSMLIYKKFIII